LIAGGLPEQTAFLALLGVVGENEVDSAGKLGKELQRQGRVGDHHLETGQKHGAGHDDYGLERWLFAGLRYDTMRNKALLGKGPEHLIEVLGREGGIGHYEDALASFVKTFHLAAEGGTLLGAGGFYKNESRCHRLCPVMLLAFLPARALPEQRDPALAPRVPEW
jgi:hypothetical protein